MLNPLNLLSRQERYALCRLIFQAEPFFDGLGLDVSLPRNHNEPIGAYTNVGVFDEVTGEFESPFYFEDPEESGEKPERGFGPEKIIWCNGNNGVDFYVIFAYTERSVYVMKLVGEIDSAYLFKIETMVWDIAVLDKFPGEQSF